MTSKIQSRPGVIWACQLMLLSLFSYCSFISTDNVAICTLNKCTVSKLNQMGPICLKGPVGINKHQATIGDRVQTVNSSLHAQGRWLFLSIAVWNKTTLLKIGRSYWSSYSLPIYPCFRKRLREGFRSYYTLPVPLHRMNQIHCCCCWNWLRSLQRSLMESHFLMFLL